MRAVNAVGACAAILFHVSNAFTHPSLSLAVHHCSATKAFSNPLFALPNDESESHYLSLGNNIEPPESTISLRRQIRYAGKQALERLDTMKAAGLYDNGMTPMQSGFKTNVGLLIGAFLFKWYRARFINKVCV